MPKDVIITPANSLIDFKDSSGNIDASIQLNDIGNLIISNPGGKMTIGNTTNLYVGDGTNSVDIIFEQNGKIRASSNKTLTLGQSDSYVTANAPFSFLSPDGTKQITARMLNTDVLSFQGGVGELLSLSDSMSGTIFSVNDVSGIPSIEVLDTGLIKLAQYSGNVVIGKANASSEKFEIDGNIKANTFISTNPNANANTYLAGDGTWKVFSGSSTGPININSTAIDADVTIQTNRNGFSVGPLDILPGATVTISPNQKWLILGVD